MLEDFTRVLEHLREEGREDQVHELQSDNDQEQ